MEAREARKYIMAHPPPDRLADRRPSIFGRLFRRSSEDSLHGMYSSSPPNEGGFGQRRGSISEGVSPHSQFVITRKRTDYESTSTIFT